MKSKKTIIDKTVYGGTLVDKYFFIFDDGTDMQVPLRVWDQYEVGNALYFKDIPDAWEDVEAFDNAVKDVEEGRTVPLDKALNEEPPSESVEKIYKQIEEIYKENERLKDDLELYKKVNLDLRKELTMTEKLLKLNMKDLHDIVDQRDWYYEEYQKLKTKDYTK